MTEVTVSEWLRLMGGENPARNECGLDCPVVGVTLFHTLHYANRRSEEEGLEPCYRLTACEEPTTGYGRVCDSATYEGPDCRGYRLPSEWEWELAANGGESACIWSEDEPELADLLKVSCGTVGGCDPDCRNAEDGVCP